MNAIFILLFSFYFLNENSDKEYFKLVNSANRFIYKSDWINADRNFNQAFKLRSPYFIDVKNSIFTKWKLEKIDEAKLLLANEIKTKDLSYKFVTKYFPYINLKESEYKSIKKKSKINIEYKSKLEAIFRLDQEVRAYHKIVLETDSIKKNQLKKSIYHQRDSVDEINTIQFIKLINKYGYPSEYNLGLHLSDSLEINHIVFVLVIHFLNTAKQQDLIHLTDLALKNGKIHPSVYANIMDRYYNNTKETYCERNFMNTTIVEIMKEAYRPFVHYTDSLMREVNNNRINIGLDSFHISQKQVACSRYCLKASNTNKQILGISPFANIDEMTLGFVKFACEKEGFDYRDNRINVQKILMECNCEDKIY